MLVYAVTIFLSAFLLFQVQPLIAKFILPLFGGSAAVWSAALLFFQLVLLAGYTYAHVLIRYLKPKQQLTVHVPLLLLSLLTLPIIPADRWKPTPGGDPTFQILLLLAATIGLPYMLLSATSPLLQAWYVRTHKGAIPYKLFALSNFGSMLALLSYPFLIEPNILLRHQAWYWSGGFALFAILCAGVAYKSSSASSDETTAEQLRQDEVLAGTAGALMEADAPPTPSRIAFWIGLSACASALLLAITSHLTQNVAPIPLLWIAPLSIYLLSFILSFESDKIYQRWLFLPMCLVALAVFTRGMQDYENNTDVIHQLIPMLCGAFFIACMVCHGELARSKPNPRYLTQFFLMVSVGGAIGGLFVAFLAPRVFPGYWELPISVGTLALLMACALWNDDLGRPRPLAIRLSLLLVVASFCVYLGRIEKSLADGYQLSTRNFYGVLRVRDDVGDFGAPGQRVLIHGTINHGTELLSADGGRTPTSYFGYTSGINRAVRAKGDHGPIRIGVLGLGAGVTATLARAGDTLHYYEINPLIFDIAQTRFDFWKACPADKKIFFGDGRLTLERMQESEQLDFLAMDAFTSDAVPMHLLTEEAYKIYAKHMKPDGVLAVNISNRYLDLEPIVAAAAASAGMKGIMIYDEGTSEPFYVANTWVLMSKDPKIFTNAAFSGTEIYPLEPKPGIRGWTDDYSNIIKILR
ncbi:MAG: fused MFS/spermidine synthase [Acidobacteriota bacterium]